jgi:hypothetical protein
MNVNRQGNAVTLELAPAEVRLLRRALERASFIDTPVSEQAEIAAFCARALERLPSDVSPS